MGQFITEQIIQYTGSFSVCSLLGIESPFTSA
jgi:hypothetical protein